jgi:hypothetical protein
MAGQQGFYPRRKFGRSGFHIAHSPIEGGKFRAQVDDANIHELAAEFSRTFLRSSHEPFTKTCALHTGTYRKQPKIAAIAALLYVDAAGLSCDEELALSQKFQHLIEIDSVVFDEESLNLERLIDDCDQTRSIILPSTANFHRNILCSEQRLPRSDRPRRGARETRAERMASVMLQPREEGPSFDNSLSRANNHYDAYFASDARALEVCRFFLGAKTTSLLNVPFRKVPVIFFAGVFN